MAKQMPQGKYLIFRKDRKTWFTRYPIPEDVREHFNNKQHHSFPIGNGSAKEIEKAHYKNVHQMDEKIEIIRSRPKSSKKLNPIERYRQSNPTVEERLSRLPARNSISAKEIASMASSWMEERVDSAKQTLGHLIELASSNPNSERLLEYQVDLDQNLELLNRTHNEEDTPERNDDALLPNALLEAKINLSQDSPSYKKLKRILWNIHIEISNWEKRCFDAKQIIPFEPKNPPQIAIEHKSPQPLTEEAESSGERITFRELFERFIKHRKGESSQTKKSLKEFDIPRQLMLEMFGDIDINELKSTDFFWIRETIDSLPDRRKNGLQGKSFGDAIKEANKLGLDRISNYTANDYRAKIRGAFAYAHSRDYIAKKYWCELDSKFNDHNRKNKANPSIERESFSNEALSKIFTCPIYTGCVGPKKGCYREGPYIFKAERFWGLLIALFTGMRRTEIAQLRVSQVLEEDGILYMHVDTLYEGQKLKTKTSKRKVPVHKELLRIGFREHLKSLKDDDLILPELAKLKDGPRASTRWFNETLLPKLKLKTEANKEVFHAFRHTFATTAIRGKSPNLEIIDELAGWSPDEQLKFRKIMRKNYTKSGYGIVLLKEEIDKIEYGFLDFSNLYPNALRVVNPEESCYTQKSKN